MMLRLYGKLLAAGALIAAVWSLGVLPHSRADSWVRPVGAPRGPVRILRFYASTGSIALGDTAELCYGVENAKEVHISPAVALTIPAATNRCMEIVPDHTTHYTILAEGFDGHVVTRFFTLVVQAGPTPPPGYINLASL